ncbi:formate dehydrogenase FDH3 subunit beta [Campylobacter mucosalis]|uniref:Formate dehydrogenase N, beta subunit, iron-sulfur cluster subunit n=1 Tax=Campylobacter mucosalis CCUG 21559 TaxID=1032067 RepID=A0A6G5QEU1_9BACT|nr:formate dehydrogenase FDH3 subunit beta [Campylobacter mucosalis]KEA45978.1 formate dehydrogenase [Campylobacter mucosalis]QCD44188.1 formate dehydrogenase N, beta subunit, iron-sulfur cluster subunit [Campylobacter mucosalis CCUG 21559]QKF63609.1 formate dehydrogenase N, beta subunit, iron-sulfur cluster subunit [Campylobacter mucosalis]
MEKFNDAQRLKFYCDDDRCIDCNGCAVACDEAHELPIGVRRRRVITLNEGIQGKEISTSIACMHCEDAPCSLVCPVDCFHIRPDGVVLHDKEVCIGCGYCLYACPFGAPQFPREGIFGAKGAMDKCTMCAGGVNTQTNSEHEFEEYGQNRIAEGKVPVCAAMCSTKALLVGESAIIEQIYLDRVSARGYGVKNIKESPTWKIAYYTKDRV